MLVYAIWESILITLSNVAGLSAFLLVFGSNTQVFVSVPPGPPLFGAGMNILK